MSGMMIAMAAPVSIGTPVTTWTGDIGGGVNAGSISVNTDGTLSGLNYSGQSNWTSPTGGQPGNAGYVKFTTVGSAWAAGLVSGTVYALTSDRAVNWSGVGGDKTGTLTVRIYTDAAGSDLVGTGTVTYAIEAV